MLQTWVNKLFIQRKQTTYKQQQIWSLSQFFSHLVLSQFVIHSSDHRCATVRCYLSTGHKNETTGHLICHTRAFMCHHLGHYCVTPTVSVTVSCEPCLFPSWSTCTTSRMQTSRALTHTWNWPRTRKLACASLEADWCFDFRSELLRFENRRSSSNRFGELRLDRTGSDVSYFMRVREQSTMIWRDFPEREREREREFLSQKNAHFSQGRWIYLQ